MDPIRFFGQENLRSLDSKGASQLPPLVRPDGPIGNVTRELYMKFPEEGQSFVISNDYVSRMGLERVQVRRRQVHDDVYQDAEIRFSADNGRTWSEFRTDPERNISVRNGYARQPIIFSPTYDPSSEKMVRLTLLRTHKGDPRISGYQQYWDHSLWQSSADDGHTWDSPKLLNYEKGPDYSRTEWDRAEFLARNRSYTGYNLQPLIGGGLATACTIETKITNEDGVKESVDGVVVFVGHWNKTSQTYLWRTSNTVAVPRTISDRGLFEGWVAQLAGGELFVDMRANRTAVNAGRSFYAISRDGGRTLSDARELKFDDGTRFLRPSSLAMLFRHSITKKLYWFGNIVTVPGTIKGNRPRYPLYVAEVDEITPALKRNTLTVIDDYDPKTQTESIQFSNFSIVEDQETILRTLSDRLGRVRGRLSSQCL